MTLAPQITFRNMDSARARGGRPEGSRRVLERFSPRIMSCRVVIEGPRRQDFGGLFNIRIDLGVPGEELVVEHDPSLHTTLQNVEATRKTKVSEPRRERRDARRAIHEAFHEMRRRLHRTTRAGCENR
ncbi:MAG: hypothetical protein ABSG41_05575 [Bryobacteraceae bacterium]|jgi:hypothetical protein